MVKTFGNFEFDDHRRNLKAGGHPARLTGHALDLLCLLLERPGELVTREEIHRKLWPTTNVDFEHSLDVVVSRLRTVLDDRAPTPRYIQTLPRKGYRFIEPVTVRPETRASSRRSRWTRRFVAYITVAVVAALAAILFARTRYDKFVPSRSSQTSPSPSTQSRNETPPRLTRLANSSLQPTRGRSLAQRFRASRFVGGTCQGRWRVKAACG